MKDLIIEDVNTHIKLKLFPAIRLINKTFTLKWKFGFKFVNK